MKLRKMVSTIIKAIGLAVGFTGVYLVLNLVGALENDYITCSQFLVYIITAFAVIGLAFIVYIIKKLFDYKYIENFYINK